ncbi:MAG: 50S ribosomal protein L9 [Bacillota bacterium]|nr:50S ribosomal protein L9 [Bacillota bacterium]
MKAILLEDARDLGKKGAVINVADGYARNYLFPRKIAVEANETNMRSLNQEKKRLDDKSKKLLAEARQAVAALDNATVTVRAKAGESGRLFGSITSKDIADAVERTFKIEIDRKHIEIDDQIKTIGLYLATLKLHQDVEVKINVHVVSEEARS